MRGTLTQPAPCRVENKKVDLILRGNYFLRQQQGFEVVQKAKEDEKLRRRSASTCALRACGETGGEVRELHRLIRRT